MKPLTSLPRRSILAIATIALFACGGGNQGGTVGMPGTGGTGGGVGTGGLYAMGSISGFGSVVVDGIKFDDLQAAVQVNGAATTSADLRLGMVASVEGQRGANVALGVASRIEVWSIAQGTITQTGNGTFTLAGMTIQANNTTVFDGISSAAQLSPGLRVAVWGLQAGIDGRSWTATRVALVSDTTTVSTGVVSVSNSQPSLNGIALTGSAAGNLTTGSLVRVQGALSSNSSSLNVTNVKLQGPGSGTPLQGEAEIEGIVTSTLSSTHFMLGSVEVDASSATLDLPTAQITTGTRLEVNGTWQAGILKAAKVEMESEQALQEAEIEAPIEQFTSLSNFVVRGQRCDASGVKSIGNGTVADLKAGVKVHLKGTKAGDVLIVTELELEK